MGGWDRLNQINKGDVEPGDLVELRRKSINGTVYGPAVNWIDASAWLAVFWSPASQLSMSCESGCVFLFLAAAFLSHF